MGYWLTLLERDLETPPKAPERIALIREGSLAAPPIGPGDRILVYERVRGRRRRPADSGPANEDGIVAVVEAVDAPARDTDPIRCRSGEAELEPRPYLPVRPLATHGFASRREINPILGYKPGYSFHSFARAHGGFRRLSRGEYEALLGVYRSHPEAARVLPPQASLEPDPHPSDAATAALDARRRMRERIAADPAGILGERGLTTLAVDRPAPAGDCIDIVLEDAQGRIVSVGVEPEVKEGDLAQIARAIRLRATLELDDGDRPGSRAFLVSYSISPETHRIADEYGVECFALGGGA